ncbi:hypothetical protein, partial [Klebsiella quasipneumoniae]|uniref:hypothetical protein n=1 Tax=Klebsiella quasipneumoniae TaxID=1463165 RepID=UPI001C49998E
SLTENTDDLFVGKTLLHGDVLMWLMKTLLTSRCINQRGAGQYHAFISRTSDACGYIIKDDPNGNGLVKPFWHLHRCSAFV